MVYRGFSVPSLKGEIRRAPDLAKDLHRTLDCVIGGPTLQLLLPQNCWWCSPKTVMAHP